MRLEEASIFLKSFSNSLARNFVERTLKTNYADAILTYHPDPSSISSDVIQSQTNELIDHCFAALEAVQHQPAKLFPVFHELSRNNDKENSIWFEDFSLAYTHYKHDKKLDNRLEHLRPYLKGSSYCDIGCGGGDLVMHLKNYHSDFVDCAGIDILDWRTESYKDKINFQMLDFSKANNPSKYQYDTLTCLAVLHHVGKSEATISTFLQNVKSAMTASSRLIIEEDVILPSDQIAPNENYLRQISELTIRQPLFKEFLEMLVQDQTDTIILIDILANCLSVGVPEMAFPCGFRTVDAWTKLFKQNGFKIEEVSIKGYVEGNFNRSSHVFFVISLA